LKRSDSQAKIATRDGPLLPSRPLRPDPHPRAQGRRAREWLACGRRSRLHHAKLAHYRRGRDCRAAKPRPGPRDLPRQPSGSAAFAWRRDKVRIMTATRPTDRSRRVVADGVAIRTLGRAPNLPSQVARMISDEVLGGRFKVGAKAYLWPEFRSQSSEATAPAPPANTAGGPGDDGVMGKAIPVVQVGVVRFLFSRVRRSGIDPFQTFVASPHMTALDRQQTFQSAVIIGAAMRP
jgi:hypothetical protein